MLRLTCWACKGSRPTAVRQTEYQYLWGIGAICPETSHGVGLFSSRLNTEVIQVFLQDFSTMLAADEQAVMIWDGARFRTSGKLIVPDNISLLRLPPYSPEPRDHRLPKRNQGKQYSLEQATSDQAQLHTIAFDGLAFLTGDFGSDTFLPPDKVSDYFGFQYMCDIDAKGCGHNTSFLTRIALNMLAILNDDQKAQLMALGKEQENEIRRFAEKRFPLIKAFRRNLEGDLPADSKGLDRSAVVKYSVDLYELDGLLAFERAKVMGGILHGFSTQQKAALAKLKFGDSGTWPWL